jgi:tetratricopeptide (TPR) repeat protein
MEEVEMLVQRGRGLVELKRHPAAIAELKKALSLDPEHFLALVLLCGCYIDTKDKKLSLVNAQKLVSVYPSEDIAHYYLALAWDLNGEPLKAMEEIRAAIEIDPYDADYFGFVAALYIENRDYKKALDFVEKGLEVNPENLLCLNHRTLILTKLGRKDEMVSAAEDTLSASPDNWYSHANVGWSYLQSSDHKKAREHFVEALRLNPNAGHAQDGMKESLKAHNIVFRWYLNYAFWMADKGDKVQWVVIIGFIFVRRIFSSLAQTYSAFYFLVAFMFLLVYSMWIMDPIGDFILLTNRFGRHLLGDHEKKAGWLTGIGLAIAIILALTGMVLEMEELYFSAGVVATAIIPLGRFFHAEPVTRTRFSHIATFVVVVLALATLTDILFINNGIWLSVYISSLVIYSFTMNFHK